MYQNNDEWFPDSGSWQENAEQAVFMLLFRQRLVVMWQVELLEETIIFSVREFVKRMDLRIHLRMDLLLPLQDFE